MSTTKANAGSGPNFIPPLLGDGHGKYRVLILGNSGSGKSTTARELAAILALPVISLDRLYWGPGWIGASGEVLVTKVTAALGKTDGSWVVEGDYSELGDFVLDKTTDVIWLDPPLALYFPRILIRTILGLLQLEEPCSPGCPELISTTLSKDSILWWCLTHHRSNRERNGKRMECIGIGCGRISEDEATSKGRRMRRLGGWGAEWTVWLASVKELVRDK